MTSTDGSSSTAGMADFVAGMVLLALLALLAVASLLIALLYCFVKNASMTTSAKWATSCLLKLDGALGLASFVHPSTHDSHDGGDKNETPVPGVPRRTSRQKVWCFGFWIAVAARAALCAVATIGWICAASAIGVETDTPTKGWATLLLLWSLAAAVHDAVDLLLELPIAAHFLLPKVTDDPASCCHLADRGKVRRWASGFGKVVAWTKAQPFIIIATSLVLLLTGIVASVGGGFTSDSTDNALVGAVVCTYINVLLRLPIFAVGVARAAVLLCEQRSACVNGARDGATSASGLARADSIGGNSGASGDDAVQAMAKGTPLTATARYNFAGRAEDELHFSKGDQITILRMVLADDGWWMGRMGDAEGMFPANRVNLDTPFEAAGDAAATPPAAPPVSVPSKTEAEV